MTETYFRKGFGLKNVIEERLVADYHSGVVEALKGRDYASSKEGDQRGSFSNEGGEK